MARNISLFITGLVFALGLGISGMTQPDKVIAFLNVAGDWDPSLAFVMGGAIVVHVIAYQLITRRSQSVFDGNFRIPTRRDITPRLVAGSVLFGFGWGLGGYCPGPALTSMAGGIGNSLVFVVSMVSGMALFHAANAAYGHMPKPAAPAPAEPSKAT